MSFELSDISIQNLTNNLNLFHQIFKKCICKGEYIEELFQQCLEQDPVLTGKVEWKYGSHKSKYDIKIPTDQISIKSGTITEGNLVSISGHRLTKLNGDLNEINKTLKSNVSNLVICCNFIPVNGKKQYIIRYLDKEVFSYPKFGSEWIPKSGKKNKSKSKITLYEWTSPNGIYMTITPSMSWQIWRNVPLLLFRTGPSILITP
jgi:hypothetical protein